MTCWVCGKPVTVGKPGQCLLCSPTYYFVLHESNCVIATCEADEAFDLRTNIEVDEIDRETFERLEAQGYTTHYE